MSAAASRNVNRAMLCCGFSAFALLYCVQPLMPEMAGQFALTPAQSSWPLSITTITLALSLLGSGALSDRIGRKRVIGAALAAAAVCALFSAFAQNFTQLLVARALLGVALGGVPAVAMAYLNDEVEPQSLGNAMGIYIAGTALGGTAGRVISALVSESLSWRWSMALMGLMGLYAAWDFFKTLPLSGRFTPARRGWRQLLAGAAGHLHDSGMRSLYLYAFLLMGVFVSLYNYVSFRLLAAPFSLPPAMAGICSLLYLSGIFSAVWAGRLADRIGRRNVLWAVTAAMLAGLLLTLSNTLIVIIAGMALFTASFFAAHSVASSWVGRRARGSRAMAAALHLFFYYVGAAAMGSLSGTAWSAGGWAAVVALLALALGAALAIAVRLHALVPLEARPACA